MRIFCWLYHCRWRVARRMAVAYGFWTRGDRYCVIPTVTSIKWTSPFCLNGGTATFSWFLRPAKKVCLKYIYGKRLENFIYLFGQWVGMRRGKYVLTEVCYRILSQKRWNLNNSFFQNKTKSCLLWFICR